MPPPALTPAEIEQLDTTFRARARALAADAEGEARSTHYGVALRQYFHDADFQELAAETGIKATAGVGIFFAVTAVSAAGVVASAVTFGVAPALGIVTGILVSKGTGEYKYQQASNRIRSAIRSGGGTFAVTDLQDAIAKVMKKYVRVMRRAQMVKGGAKGAAYALRHPKTAIKAQFGKHDAPVGSFSAHDDRDLNERLLELRYYAQMTYNVVGQTLDGVLNNYNLLCRQAQLTYAHIVRQVHFTGHHVNCGSRCKSISQDEFKRNLRAVRPPPPKGNVLTRGYHERKYFKEERTDLGAKALPRDHDEQHWNPAPPIAVNTAHFHQHLRNEHALVMGAPGRGAGGMAWDVSKERFGDYATGVTGDVSAGMATKGASGFIDEMGASSPKEFGDALGETVGEGLEGTAAGFGMGLGADLLIGFARERYSRRVIRSRVLGARGDVMTLLRKGDQASQAESEGIAKLLRGNDKDAAPRIVEKILWYIEKINDLEKDAGYEALQRNIRLNGNSFARSVFSSCDEAWEFWRATYYLVRQYSKLITNLVFLEAILLQTDRKVADAGIGVMRGSVVRDGAGTPPRPGHMKD